MKISVQYFAHLKDKLGKDTEELILDEGSRVSDLLELIIPDENQRNTMQSFLRVAVNQEYGSMNQILSNNDEVVFVPPVAGG